MLSSVVVEAFRREQTDAGVRRNQAHRDNVEMIRQAVSGNSRLSRDITARQQPRAAFMSKEI